MSIGHSHRNRDARRMSRSDAAICTDMARAAATDATAAIIRKCNLMPPAQRIAVLRIALGLIAQKSRALTQVLGPSPIDATFACTDDLIEATLRKLAEDPR